MCLLMLIARINVNDGNDAQGKRVREVKLVEKEWMTVILHSLLIPTPTICTVYHVPFLYLTSFPTSFTMKNAQTVYRNNEPREKLHFACKK